MFARVTTNQIKPENLEAAVRNFKDLVGSVVKKLPGFKGSYLLVDRKTGKMVGIALWEKKEDLEASDKAAAQIRGKIAQAGGATGSPVVEVYEVAAQL